jgi:hypothetical protein
MASKGLRVGLVLFLTLGSAAGGIWALNAPKRRVGTEPTILSAQTTTGASVETGGPALDDGDGRARSASTNRVGQRLTYAANFFLEALGKDDTSPRTVVVGNAKLALSIVADNDQDLEYAALLSDIAVTGDSERQGSDFTQKITESMKVPFALHMTPAGQVSSIAFPPEGNEVGAGIMRGLASALQFSWPAEAGQLPKAWSVNESDNLGDYVATYEVAGKTEYKKSAKDYARLELSRAFQVMQGQRQPSAHLEGTYQIDDAKRIRVAKLTQTMLIPSSNDGTGTISSTYRLELKEVSRGGSRIAGSESWRRLPLVATLQVTENSVSEKQNRDILGDATWESLQTDNLEAIKAGDEKARLRVGRRMMALFQLEPKKARDAVITLRRTRDPKEAQTVLGALSGARVAEALKAIQDTATDRNVKPEIREAAIGHLGLSKEPTVDTVNTLLKVASTEADPTLRNQAILSLGDAAGKLSNSATANDSDLAKQSIAGLADQLHASKDPQNQVLYLQALGNAGGTNVHSATADYINSTDPSVRQAAIFAQRYVSGEEADKAIVSALLKDEDPALRGTAAQAASFRTLTPTLLAGITEGLQTEQQGGVRNNIVECLGAFLPQSPSVIRRLLQAVAQNDPDPQVRDSAVKVLNSAPEK